MGWSGEGKEGGRKRGREREKKKEREKLNKECISSGLRQVLLSLDLEKSHTRQDSDTSHLKLIEGKQREICIGTEMG